VPLIVVLLHGRPASFGPGNALLANFSALLSAWRPGEAGATALARVLTGAVSPSGKLASQWAQHVGHMASGFQPFLARRVGKWLANNRSAVDATDGRGYDPYVQSAYPQTPLFRMGSGLSFTEFSYSGFSVNVLAHPRDLPRGGLISGGGRAGYVAARATAVVSVNVTVCNSGGMAGSEVVQVYSQDARGPGTYATPIVPFWKRLVAFTRVGPLAPGACAAAAIPVLADDLALYDSDMDLRLLPGQYVISAGGASDTDVLQQVVTLEA
jgi:hypothetical protein